MSLTSWSTFSYAVACLVYNRLVRETMFGEWCQAYFAPRFSGRLPEDLYTGRRLAKSGESAASGFAMNCLTEGEPYEHEQKAVSSTITGTLDGCAEAVARDRACSPNFFYWRAGFQCVCTRIGFKCKQQNVTWSANIYRLRERRCRESGKIRASGDVWNPCPFGSKGEATCRYGFVVNITTTKSGNLACTHTVGSIHLDIY